MDRWPDVSVQVHTSEQDPWVDGALLDGFAQSASAAVFRYAGRAHLFADKWSADYEPKNAEVQLEWVRSFVRR
jgi:hypothetical protein